MAPLIINQLPKKADKEIRMGKEEPVKDYYPPGATEPQVRPAHIPAEGESEEVDEDNSLKEAARSAPVARTVKKESASESIKKTAARKK